MAEWHVGADAILERWTLERFALLLKKMLKRREAMAEAMGRGGNGGMAGSGVRWVEPAALVAQMGMKG